MKLVSIEARRQWLGLVITDIRAAVVLRWNRRVNPRPPQ
jgi:hypothetical protein